MKLKIIALTFFITLFGLLSVKSAFAATYQLSGKVTDSSGTAIAGSTIDVFDTGTTTNAVPSITTDNSGNYTTNVTGGTYDIKVTPPVNNSFTSAIALSKSINSDTVLNFILVPAGSVSLSGHVFDALGNSLQNQFVALIGSNNTFTSTRTDSSGSYSLQVVSDNYNLVFGTNQIPNSLSTNAPQGYALNVQPYSLTQSALLDVSLPAKKVIVHVQDTSGNPINNVQIATSPYSQTVNYQGLSIGGGITNASGGSGYDANTGQGAPLTDSLGNASLWLFPTNAQGTPYIFTAIPPNGSNFATTTVSNIAFTNDTTVTITLPAPVSLSGHVYDASGNPLQNQWVALLGANNNIISTRTDAFGTYSVQVLPGAYSLIIGTNQIPNGLSVSAPQTYKLTASYPITENSTLDITLPAKRVNIHVQGGSGNSVGGVQITTLPGPGGEENHLGLSIGEGITNASGTSNYDFTNNTPQTDASGNVTLWLFPNNAEGNSYSFVATPPTGSNFPTTTLSNITFTDNIAETIVLQSPVSLTGHVFDALGNPLQNQWVALVGSDNTLTSTRTAVSGSYALQVVSGNYNLVFSTNQIPNSLSTNAPQTYSLNVPYSLTQNAFADITLPAKKITVHVQDEFGNPISHVFISTFPGLGAQENYQGLAIGGGITNASGGSNYDVNIGEGAPQTNTSGDATLWLFPNNAQGSTYEFIATPPSGSIYSAFSLSNINVTSDQTELISLQYNHATPVTTATLTTQNADGTYSNPTTVNISATAASGYTIANTYYTIDGGAQQTYSSPFTVSGSDSHTITYWSIDNVGMLESPNTKTFTISSRQLIALSPAKIWVGLRNSDDVGIKFDLLAEVYNGSTLITSGELDSVIAGSSGFWNAKLDTISFNAFSPVDFPAGSQLSLKLYVRNACTGSRHNSGTARLWYNDSSANSQFGATIGTNTNSYYLVSSAMLSTSVGSGPKRTVDVAAGTRCSAFKPFGTWSITP